MIEGALFNNDKEMKEFFINMEKSFKASLSTYDKEGIQHIKYKDMEIALQVCQVITKIITVKTAHHYSDSRFHQAFVQDCTKLGFPFPSARTWKRWLQMYKRFSDEDKTYFIKHPGCYVVMTQYLNLRRLNLQWMWEKRDGAKGFVGINKWQWVLERRDPSTNLKLTQQQQSVEIETNDDGGIKSIRLNYTPSEIDVPIITSEEDMIEKHG